MKEWDEHISEEFKNRINDAIEKIENKTFNTANGKKFKVTRKEILNEYEIADLNDSMLDNMHTDGTFVLLVDDKILCV